jgi:lipoprotein-anchoring transpeptidase ErfK/SrfK
MFARLQVLLDREGFSPGAINGRDSKFFRNALAVYKQSRSEWTEKQPLNLESLSESVEDVFIEYTLTKADIVGPYLETLPKRIQDQAGLKALDFLTVEEAIAERFHMDEDFFRRMNKDVDFTVPGNIVKVANVGKSLDIKVARIVADKTLKQVLVYDAKGRVLAYYPASIGSAQTPSPQGVFKVRNKAGFPAYTLSPDNGFEPIDDGRQVIIAPGPNNPVGSAWIGLSQRTYGIHGTPDPSRVGLSESNGCIRLTNWDALELARLVSTGIEVVID